MRHSNAKKAFTLLELIVVIAVIGILVLIGSPRIVGYVEKAQLTRIQHDVKVMEQEMKIALIDEEVNLANWSNNEKDLGALVLQSKLFEKEGVAKRVNKEQSNKLYSATGKSNLGVGGDLISLSNIPTNYGYKIIPGEYSEKIGTKLGGTFYANDTGKVYYEHEKPLTSQKEKAFCSAQLALPDYDFEYSTGKIVKYLGSSQHLEIPAAFKNPETDECVTVKIIGTGAFMQGGYKTVIIPDSVVEIQDDAFSDNEFTKVEIPHSVTKVGNNAFGGNYIEDGNAVIRNKPGKVNLGNSVFQNNGPEKNSVITPSYKIPSDKDLGIVFDKSTGTIVVGSSGNGTSVNIPGSVSVGGIEYPVKKIEQGAYQGVGLISVVLPEGLEVIEDYAFSGNQLVGVTIPNSVYHIGNYAFSFNEQTHSLTGDVKATIKSVVISGSQQINKINSLGNITVNGTKVATLDGKVRLLDHIFVTGIDNHVVDEKYNPSIGNSESSKPMFNVTATSSTSVGKVSSGTIKWIGNLEEEYVELKATTYYRAGGGTNNILYTIVGNNGAEIGRFSNPGHSNSSGMSQSIKVKIPKDAAYIKFSVSRTYANTGYGFFESIKLVE